MLSATRVIQLHCECQDAMLTGVISALPSYARASHGYSGYDLWS